MEEIWLPIEGWTGYEVSDLGRVRSMDREVRHPSGGVANKRERVLRPAKQDAGYIKYCLSQNNVKKSLWAHRLVAKAFLPPDPSRQDVNHKDLNKANNAATNLEWVTPQENTEHASVNGRLIALTSPSRAKKLDIETVKAIHAARTEGMTQSAIGLKFGISQVMAGEIVRGQSWAGTK